MSYERLTESRSAARARRCRELDFFSPSVKDPPVRPAPLWDFSDSAARRGLHAAKRGLESSRDRRLPARRRFRRCRRARSTNAKAKTRRGARLGATPDLIVGTRSCTRGGGGAQSGKPRARWSRAPVFVEMEARSASIMPATRGGPRSQMSPVGRRRDGEILTTLKPRPEKAEAQRRHEEANRRFFFCRVA